MAESISIEWQGKQFDPGPLNIELDDSVGTHNGGELDYAALQAEAEFHVLLSFPEFADPLEQLGADPELTKPVHAVIHSKGSIREDHSFVLSGPSALEPHALLTAQDTRAFVLAGPEFLTRAPGRVPKYAKHCGEEKQCPGTSMPGKRDFSSNYPNH